MIIKVFTIGMTIILPTICDLFRLNQFRSFFGALKNLDKEGISAANVAQNPILLMTTTINAVIAAPPVTGLSTHPQISLPCDAA